MSILETVVILHAVGWCAVALWLAFVPSKDDRAAGIKRGRGH
jgi:hypothetical protein